MAPLDLAVVVCCVLAVLGVGVWAGRREKSTSDYFLGGRRQPWPVVGLSILAAQVTALTFVGVPGDAYAGDCHYLQLSFGSFLGQMAIVWLLLPAFYGAQVTTVYQFLGRRFGPWTRSTASILFLVGRTLGTGLRLLAAGIALSYMIGWPIEQVILGAAAVATAYTAFGGIKAIIWTDALKAIIFLAGAAAALIFAVSSIPGRAAENLATAHAAGKFRVFNWSLRLNDDTSFWVLLIHTLFLNAATFGTDQDFTQRMLTCPKLADGQRSLTLNAVLGFPVVILFLTLGVMLAGYYDAFPHLAPPSGTAVDQVFPRFIAEHIPAGTGLRGLLLASVLALGLSTMDSALGALASSAVVDFYEPYVARDRPTAHYVRAGRFFVVIFGVIITGIALAFIHQQELLWEAFKWASLIFGPLLGAFLLAVTTERRGHDRVLPGIMLVTVAGLVILKYRQDPADPYLAWPWWIVVGTMVTFSIGAAFPSRVSESSSNR